MPFPVCSKCGEVKRARFSVLKSGKVPSYCRACSSKAALAWNLKYPGRILAHKLVKAAVKEGILIRAACCSACGKRGYTHGHHEDYRKALDVVWLCYSCHALRHVELRKLNPRKDMGDSGPTIPPSQPEPDFTAEELQEIKAYAAEMGRKGGLQKAANAANRRNAKLLRPRKGKAT